MGYLTQFFMAVRNTLLIFYFTAQKTKAHEGYVTYPRPHRLSGKARWKPKQAIPIAHALNHSILLTLDIIGTQIYLLFVY